MTKKLKRWRAKKDKFYFTPALKEPLYSKELIDFYDTVDSLRFKFGCYFKTQEQATEFARECKKLAMRLHRKWKE